VAAQARGASWELITRDSGLSRERIEAFADLLVARPRTVLVWSMGLTQHAHGVDTVKALVNVALARGLPGRPNAGLVPIRGHSGVQGGAEVGCTPGVDAETAARWADCWGFSVPDCPGWTATEMVQHAARGEVDVFWNVGGNFLETLGDEAQSRAALRRPRLRVHQDIVLSSSMLVESDGDVLLLPATTRYESPGGGTETSTERRIIFSPEIPGRRIGSAQPEWWVFRELMRRVRPERAARVGLEDAAAIRREIAAAVPLYAGIDSLAAQGDQVQWGGARLYEDGRFATQNGRAQFAPVTWATSSRVAGTFTASSRRGKQFNSMVQRELDPLNGAKREDILISGTDLAALGLTAGRRVTLRSAHGTFTGTLKAAPIKDGNLEVHWPEGNSLLDASRLDRTSMEPDYNAVVTLELHA
jgi:predicted molibdopterin-dependent oxidoreductase YjgC